MSKSEVGVSGLSHGALADKLDKTCPRRLWACMLTVIRIRTLDQRQRETRNNDCKSPESCQVPTEAFEVSISDADLSLQCAVTHCPAPLLLSDLKGQLSAIPRQL